MTQLIILAIIAYFIYRIYKGYQRFEHVSHRRSQPFNTIALDKESIQNSELGLFVALVAKVAKADGRVDELEAELISNLFSDIASIFDDTTAAKDIFKEIFNQEKQIRINVDNIATQLYQLTFNSLQKRMTMMQFLCNLAYVDGELSHAEEAMLLKIGAFLHIDAVETIIKQCASNFSHVRTQSSVDEAYALLEANDAMTLSEIKKCYRNKIKAYHPDIVKAQGKDEAYLKEATQKAQEINAAYELIKSIKQ